MDCMNVIDSSKNFGIQKLSNDKVLIDIPMISGNWKKEYDMDIPLSKIINDFKAENNLDISDFILNKFKTKNGTIDLNYKLKDIIDIGPFPNYKNHTLVGKPFNNPFEIFIFNKNNKILTIQPTQKQLITSLGLNNYSSSSSYCNGNNHLYISGGETPDNQIIDKFFDIDLNNNNNIEGPYTISPKKNHSMIFIQPNKVFVVGGNDTKTFYFDTIKKEIIITADLNIIRTEPALQIIGNTLYCFDNVNKANNDQLSFERINIENPEAEWELVRPIIKGDKFPQKFFAVSKDINEENIIFLGGNMDDTNDTNNLNNYKYNIETNTIEETSIPFKDFNYKEKTFLPFNKHVDYLLPDFNRQHPEVTFFVKSKSRFEKVNYLPKPIENENNKYLRSRYLDNKYNFNMPGVGISVGNNNIIGIKEPSFNNNIDLENQEIQIKQEPPFKEPDIKPNEGDKQIDIAIPTNLNIMTKGINKYNINKKKLIEEEKNSDDKQITAPKVKYGEKPIYTSFNKNDLNKDSPKIQTSLNENEKILNYNFNLKESLGLDPEMKIKNQGKNTNIESCEDSVHLPKNKPINLGDIKVNIGFEQPKNDLIKENLNEPKIELKENIEDPTKNINSDLNTNIPGINLDAKIPSVGIDVNKKDLNLKTNKETSYEGIIFGKDKKSEGYNLQGIIMGNKNYKSKIGITNPDLNIKGKDNNLNLDGNIPNPELKLNGKIGGDIDTKLPGLKNKIDLDDIELKGSKNIELNGEIPNADLKNKLDTNLDLKGNINVPDIKLKTDINKDINIKSPQKYENITGIILGKKDKLGGKDLNINANLPETKITGEIPGKGSLDINNPKLDIKGQKIGTDLDVNIPSAKMNLEGAKLNGPNFELKGDIPGKNINEPKLDSKTGNIDLKGKVEIPNANTNVNGPNINAKMPNIKTGDINIKGKDETLIFSGIIPGKKDIKIPKINGDVKIEGNTKKTELPDLNIGIGANMKNKEIDLNNKIKDININSPGIGITPPDINLKGKNINMPNASIEGNIPNVDINGNMPKIEGNIPGIDIEPKIPNSDVNVNLGQNISDMKLNAEIPNIDANFKKPEFDSKGEINPNIPNINIDKKDLPTGDINFDGNLKNPDLKGINLKTNMPEIDIKKPEGNINIDGEIEGKKINIDLPNIQIGKEGEYSMTGIIPGKDYFKIKGGKKIDLEGSKPKVVIKGGKGINAQINSPNVDLPSGNLDIKGPKFDSPDLKANIKGKDINIDGKMPKVKKDLNINLPKGDLIYSGIIGGKNNLKGKNINIPNASIEGNIPNVDINGKVPNVNVDIPNPNMNIEGKIPNTDMNINEPKIDLQGNLPKINMNADIKKTNMDINGEINPNLNLSPNIDLPQGEMNLKSNIPDLNLNGDINAPKIDASIEPPKLNDINLKANIPKANIDVKKPDLGLNIDGEIKDKKLNVDLPNAKINNEKEYCLTGIIPGKGNNDINIKGSRRMLYDYDINKPDVNIKSSRLQLNQNDMDMNIKGSRRLYIEAPNINANIKGSRVLPNMQIKSPNIDKPSRNLNIKGPNVEVPNVNIKDKNIKLKGKMQNVKADLNINEPKGDLIYSGIIGGKKNIKTPKINGDIKLDGKLKRPKIEGPNIDLKKPKIDLDMKKNINLNKEININSPEIGITSSDINLKGKNINIPNASLEGNIPKVNLKGNIPKLEGNIPGIDIDAKMPNVDVNGQIPNVNVDIPNPNMNIEGNIPNLNVEGNIPNVDMNINSPKIDLKGNLPNPDIEINKKDLNLPGVGIKGNVPNLGINGKLDTNLPNLEINNDNEINIPSGDIKVKGKIPNMNLNGNIENKEINVPKIDAKIETPKVKDINLNANLPGIDINKKDINIEGDLGGIKKSDGSFNIIGEIEGKGIKIEKRNIKLNKDKEYYISGIIPGGNINDMNIKGSRRMLYNYDINQPETNIKSSKIKINPPDMDMNIKGSRRLDFKGPNINDNIKGSRVLYNSEINNDYKISYNKPEIKLNSPKIELNSGNKNIKLEKPELKTKTEGELIYSGLIPGKKEYSKNIKLSANIPKPEIKANIEKQDIPKKIEIETGINPSLKNGINIDTKDINILSDQNLEIKVENQDNKDSLKASNNNINIEMPKFDIEVNKNENINEINPEINIEGKNANIEIPQLEINLETKEKEQNNNLFNININNNLENPNGSLEVNNSKNGHESKVYTKKGIKSLPKVGSKKEEFISSKIDVGGKLDVNNIDLANMKPADAGANGTKIGNRIIE